MDYTKTPNLSPLGTTFAPLAILLPPLSAPTRACLQEEAANPCTSLTPAALQQVIDKVKESLDKAESDVIANYPTGLYAAAAVYNRNYLDDVHQNLLFLQSWLKNLGLDSPFVTNTTAAFNIHSYVREAVYLLHNARHWATISVVSHTSPDAFDSYNLTSEAINLAEVLGTPAGLCYMRAYFP
jgi:hypothetical protein